MIPKIHVRQITDRLTASIASGMGIRQIGGMKAAEQIFNSDLPVILVGASPVELGSFFLSLPEAWPVIAADGGVDKLAGCGRRPELVIGDMDSVTALPADIPHLLLTGQDDTDFEKCLARIRAPLIVGFGFLDGRLDHSLAVMHALAAQRNSSAVMLCGTHDVLACLRGDITFAAAPGARVSIWPLGRQAFRRSDGLRWPLDGLEMQLGGVIGTSNEASAEQVEIEAAAGDGYAVIMPVSCADLLLAAMLPSG